MHIFHKYEPISVTNYHYTSYENIHLDLEPTHTAVVSKCRCGKIKSEDFHGVFTLKDLQLQEK